MYMVSSIAPILSLILFVYIVECARFAPLINVDPDTSPLPRENFAITINPFSQNSAILFGGNYYQIGTTNVTFYNDLWQFQLIDSGGLSYFWEQINTTGDIPSERSFHCFNAITLSNQNPFVLLFGGSIANLETGEQEINDDFAYLYEPYTQTWVNITSDALSDGLIKRSGSTCASIQNSVYIYGGVAENNTILNDLWVYNLTTHSFTFLSLFPSEARWNAQFGITKIGQLQYLFLIGGINTFPIFLNGSLNIDVTNILHEMWSYGLSNSVWTNVSIGLSNNYSPRRIGTQVYNSYNYDKVWIYGGNILNNTLTGNQLTPLNTTKFRFNVTTCQGTTKGFTVPEFWSFDNRVAAWNNETLNLSFNPLNNTFIPPIFNHKGFTIGGFFFTLGGLITQCPLNSGLWNTNVTRIITDLTFPFN